MSKATYIKTKPQIEIMRKNGKIHSQIVAELEQFIRVGISTMDVENKARELGKKLKINFSQIGYFGYPYAICIGINDDSIHTMPSKEKIIKDGDIVHFDTVIESKGLMMDGGRTVAVGNVDKVGLDLVKCAELTCFAGIKSAKRGAVAKDVGGAMFKVARSYGFDVIRDHVAHGVGLKMHEFPQIPNFPADWGTDRLKVGMTIALDTMILEGTGGIKLLSDGWSTKTKDGKRFAFYERTFLITEDGQEILN